VKLHKVFFMSIGTIIASAFTMYIVDSIYSLIGKNFIIWRLIKDFKSDSVFSAGFDYDIYYDIIKKCIYCSCTNM
jgi:hypothetical protein